MKKLVLVAALALVGCNNVQGAVEDSDYVCKGGVEYFVYSKYTGNGYSYSVVPHFKNTKGELWGCDPVTGWREAVSGPREIDNINNAVE